jgi:hypothetical protein
MKYVESIFTMVFHQTIPFPSEFKIAQNQRVLQSQKKISPKILSLKFILLKKHFFTNNIFYRNKNLVDHKNNKFLFFSYSWSFERTFLNEFFSVISPAGFIIAVAYFTIDWLKEV